MPGNRAEDDDPKLTTISEERDPLQGSG